MLKAGIRRQTIANNLSRWWWLRLQEQGVQYLVDAVIDYLPARSTFRGKGQDPDDSAPMEAPRTMNAKFCSLAFKLWSDPFVGKLVFFRVYSGKVTKGDTVYNPRTNKRDRISRLIQIQADKREDIDTIYSGDIAAIVGIKNVTTGDTLCDEDHPILLEPPSFPDPVISMSIEPKTKLDQEKMAIALQRLAEEDPTSASSPTKTPARRSSRAWASFTSKSFATDAPRVQGGSELRQAADRLSRNDHAAGDGEGKLIKQSAVAVNTATSSSMSPGERGKGSSSRTRSSAARFRRNTSRPARRDRRGDLNGVVGGYPVIDVEVDIIDGSYHDVDSNELAFKMAAIFAVKDGFKKATPSSRADHEGRKQHPGRIPGRHHGRPQPPPRQIKASRARTIFRSSTPKFRSAEMFRLFATAIRSLSKGRSSYFDGTLPL
jgi:elongation factor G